MFKTKFLLYYRTDSELYAIVQSYVRREDPRIERENFTKSLEVLAPDLARLSAHNHTTVVFKMLDVLQVRLYSFVFIFLRSN